MAFELSDDEGTFLVSLSRKAATTFLTSGKYLKAPENTPAKMLEKCGVFVTISSIQGMRKTLRGCIGYPYPTSRLVDAVIDNAINAATQDPRFNSMIPNELEHVVFEVSVLTPPEPINVEKPEQYLKKIKVGEHGLIVEKEGYKGLLLPQVPVEWGWCEEEFLCECCLKAGLSPDSWLTEGVKIEIFRAIVFEEETPNGKVKRKSLSEV